MVQFYRKQLNFGYMWNVVSIEAAINTPRVMKVTITDLMMMLLRLVLSHEENVKFAV